MIKADCSMGEHQFCDPCECKCHGVQISREEVKQLFDILNKEYISYELHPLIVQLVQRLREELIDDKGELD